MNTRTLSVLLATIGAVAVLPSLATGTVAMERESRQAFDADRVLRQLQDRGIAATAVEQWNGLIRAYVEVDGSQIMQYFDPDTLAPVEV